MKFFTKLLIPFIIAILVSILIIILSSTKIFDVLELKSLDQRFTTRFHTPLRNKDIIIIAIDDASLANNKKPLLFWGKEFGMVIQKLSENNVKVIALDYMQKIPLEDYLSENDEKFAASLLAGKTVLLTYIDYDTREFEKPPPALVIAAAGNQMFKNMGNTGGGYTLDNNLGAGNTYSDIDGFFRSQSLLINDKDNVPHASLALATVAKYLGTDLKELKEADGKLSLGKKIIPLSDKDKKMIYVNFVGPANTFPSVPFCEVLEMAKKNQKDYFKEKFSGKIALIGITSMSQQDFVLTPYNSMLFSKMMNGIEFHANTINTMLEENYIHRTPKAWINLCILLFTILTATTCTLMNFSKSSAVSAGLLLICIISSFLSFNFYNTWIDTVAPVSAILICYAAVSVYNYLLLDKEKKKIKFMFERFVSEPIVKRMLSEPGSFALGGQKKEVTVLFSDINDFTTISEKTPPEDLIQMLNTYLTIMTDIILESEGTLNQFVGDEIMVIYGAPLEQEDHPVRAVKTAVAMLKKLDELRENGELDIKVKIGIHTGEAVLGNVGSKKRMQYTAVGDNVNFTSRVESLNKELGTYLLISEETYKRVSTLEKDGIKFIPMTPKMVKGKSGTYQTYEVKY